MTVKELIAELQKMPPNATVSMLVEPGRSYGVVNYVEKRFPGNDTVFLNDKYWTPYADLED